MIEHSAPPATLQVRPSVRQRLLLVLLLAGAMFFLVFNHADGINGPWYWIWPWRHVGAWPLYPLMALAAVPFFIGQWYFNRSRSGALALGLLMISTFALQITMISHERMGFSRVGAIVENSVNTSYYTAAREFVHQGQAGVSISDWMVLYPDLLQYMQVHAKYKPPGLVLFYVAIIKLFGENSGGQMAGGLIIGLVATLSVAGTYWLIRRLGKDADAAWCGASFMALCPSLILFFPQFDQFYPAVACAMVLTWCEALEQRSIRLAVLFGVVLTLATFMSYILLVMGLFLAVYTILYAGRERLTGIDRIAQYAILAISTCVLLYAILWQATGFNPIATLQAANALQEKDLIPLMRPFPGHIAWDVYDFALGSGWIGFAIAGLLFVGHFTALGLAARRLVWIALLQIAVVAAAALLPGETARLWMLLYPMLMVPIGFELARWPARYRLIVFIALLLLTTVIGQNMIFMNMGEGHH